VHIADKKKRPRWKPVPFVRWYARLALFQRSLLVEEKNIALRNSRKQPDHSKYGFEIKNAGLRLGRRSAGGSGKAVIEDNGTVLPAGRASQVVTGNRYRRVLSAIEMFGEDQGPARRLCPPAFKRPRLPRVRATPSGAVDPISATIDSISHRGGDNRCLSFDNQ